MSQRDRDRLIILRQVDRGNLTVSEGARRARLSLRQFRRLLRRFEAEGDRAVVHRARGPRPNNATDPLIRQRALERAREPLNADFGPTLLSEGAGVGGTVPEPDFAAVCEADQGGFCFVARALFAWAG